MPKATRPLSRAALARIARARKAGATLIFVTASALDDTMPVAIAKLPGHAFRLIFADGSAQ